MLEEEDMEGMFRKINAVFRPNLGQRHRDGQRAREDDYHSACTVKLVRSTSMLVMGDACSSRANRTPRETDATLKRSKSTLTLESSTTTTTTTALYYYRTRQDQIWLYTRNQNCLQYLQELVALRRQYTQSIINLQNAERRNSLAAGNKKHAPQPPRTKATQVGFSCRVKHLLTQGTQVSIKSQSTTSVDKRYTGRDQVPESNQSTPKPLK